MKRHLPWAAALLWATLMATPAQAGEGHDHGDAPTTATGQALPRFTAASESFELVGVLSGRQITLYLDRFADNSPVRGAQIELEVGSTKFKAEPVAAVQTTTPADAVYQVTLPAEPAPGVLPVTATVVVGQEADLLAGELDIHAGAHDHAVSAARPWKTWAAGLAAAVAALGLLVYGVRRSRLERVGGAA